MQQQEHKDDIMQSDQGGRMPFVVFGQAPESCHPAETPLGHPAAGKQHKAPFLAPDVATAPRRLRLGNHRAGLKSGSYNPEWVAAFVRILQVRHQFISVTFLMGQRALLTDVTPWCMLDKTLFVMQDMTTERQNFDFPEHTDENRRIWDANAHSWDDRIGDGNDFQTLLIEPATERLLESPPA